MKKLIKIVLPIVLCITMLMPIFLCGCANYGTFYPLEQAYNDKLISYEDLLNIAYHTGNYRYNEELFENFTPTEKGELDKSVERTIKKALSKRSKSREKPDTFIISYYGCYNGYYVVKCDNEDWLRPAVIIEGFDVIDGVRFRKGFLSFELWKK